MIHYTGAITIPENQTISFMVASDDGGTVKIGDTAEFGTWNYKGCSWSARTSFALPAGTYPLDGWFFEATGGACYILAWSINGAGWQIVPDSAFTTQVALTTTTTTSSTSTTTTTVEPSTTTTLPATTSIPVTTSTAELPTTTRPTETTTVYIAPITTPVVLPVQEPVVVVPTGTIAQVIEVRPIETTLPVPVSTSIPKIDVPLTTETTLPETTAPPTSITVPFVPRPNTIAPTLTVPQTILPVETTQQTAPVQPQVQTTQTEIPPVTSSLPVTIPAQASNEQITQLVSNPETLKALTVDQAEELFEQLDVTVLDNTELEAFTEAIQVAPVEVRKAFEKKVNIFGSQFEDYVPAGSNIPVSERRSLVAAGALIATGSSSRMRRK